MCGLQDEKLMAMLAAKRQQEREQEIQRHLTHQRWEKEALVRSKSNDESRHRRTLTALVRMPHCTVTTVCYRFIFTYYYIYIYIRNHTNRTKSHVCHHSLADELITVDEEFHAFFFDFRDSTPAWN